MFRRLFVATAGIALSTAATASHASASNGQWALLAEGMDFTYYVDSGSITDLPQQTLRFRTLIDLVNPDIFAGEVSYSTISEWLMDCNAKTIGPIRVTTYEGHCAGGREVATELPRATELRPVVPQSAFSIAMEMLCLPEADNEEEIIDFARESWLVSRPSGACSQ
jgi:hypothetical protein